MHVPNLVVHDDATHYAGARILIKQTINYCDVLGLGTVAVDYVGVVDNWPAEGAKKHLQHFALHDGG